MVEILTSFPDTGEKVSYFTMKCDVNWKVSQDILFIYLFI